MKVLLDENLPLDFRYFLTGHDVFTVDFTGWKGIQNGKLLSLAAFNRFDALISKDAGIEYQHNLAQLSVSVVLLRAKTNSLDDLIALVPSLLPTLDALQPRSVVRIGA
ncbi:MAG: DUF5615 family PIN-like protein [Pyrinomonadaceae bacterium]|nr:DUF5615 family PIN-like protein [Phycisphaerales bacterium]